MKKSLQQHDTKLVYLIYNNVMWSYFTVLFAYVYVFSFYSITPLCPYYVCSNTIMIIFSVDGHHLAFLYGRTSGRNQSNINSLIIIIV